MGLTPRPPELVDVRRLFALFILLVVLPAVGLVGFGLVAITNERAVVEQRFNAEYAARLRALAGELAEAMDVAIAEPRTLGGLRPEVEYAFALGTDGLSSTRALPDDVGGALLTLMGANARAPRGVPSIVSVHDGPARGIYAITRREGAFDGIAFDEAALGAQLARRAKDRFPSEPATFTLEGPREQLPAGMNPVRRLYDELANAPDAGTPVLALPGPLSDWRLVARLPDGDVVNQALWRNRGVYIAALVIFYLVLGIGVVVTLRGIRREAQLSQLKTDFVSNISHELRTPLTSIRLFAETLRLGRATSQEERDACLDFITREAERLSALTERTLDWARIEAGSRRYELAETEVGVLVRGVCERFLVHGQLPRDRLAIEIAPGLPRVAVDAAAFEQVLVNLLENAVKYTLNDKRISVRAFRDRARVHVEVTDNGIGISRRDQRRVFERFFRADDRLARRTEGSGLGLSIARRIVEAHEGRIVVRSKVGAGSTFDVELPIPKQAAAHAAPEGSA